MKIRDYPPVFWAAITATIVGGWMSIAAYSAMMHSDDAVIRAAGIFVTLECVSIFSAATLNNKGQGLLVGLAFTLIVGCATAEIFLGASELQRGVMQMTETAKASSAGTANSTATATALAEANKGIADCQKRYPRKNRDAVARSNCEKQFQPTIKTLSVNKPVDQVAFNAEAAAMLAQWEAIAAIYNDNVSDGNKVEAGQIAMIVMLFIFSVFVIGKLFLWAKYSSWKNANGFNDESNSATVVYPESELGIDLPDPVIKDEPKKQEFGFTGGRVAKAHAGSTRTGNDVPAQVNTRAGNIPAQVNTRAGNDTGGSIHASEHVHAGTQVDMKAYTHAADALAGTVVDCPWCGVSFKKVNKQHTFHSTDCKYKWWNAKDPSRLKALRNKKH